MKSSHWIRAGAFAMLTMSTACGAADEAPDPAKIKHPATPAYTPTPPPGVLAPSPAPAPVQQPPPAPQPPPQPTPPVAGAPAPAVDPEVRFGRGYAKCRELPFVDAEIMGPRCALCHDQSKVSTFAEIDLRAPGWRNNLRGLSRVCPDRRLVVTRPTVGGFFFEQLAGPVVGCGDRMPPLGAALSVAEIECLKTYMIATE